METLNKTKENLLFVPMYTTIHSFSTFMAYHDLQNVKAVQFCSIFVLTGKCYSQTTSAGIQSQRHLLEYGVKTGKLNRCLTEF